MEVHLLVDITCGSLPSTTDSGTRADQLRHARQRHRLTRSYAGLRPLPGQRPCQGTALACPQRLEPRYVEPVAARSSSFCDNVRRAMTAFLSLDDTTPPSGFVHSMAGCAASGGQVAGQDIAGMASRAIVFTLANPDPKVGPLLLPVFGQPALRPVGDIGDSVEQTLNGQRHPPRPKPSRPRCRSDVGAARACHR